MSLESRVSKLEGSLAVEGTESTDQFLLRLTDEQLAEMKAVWNAGCQLFGERLLNSDPGRSPGQSRVELARYWVTRFADVNVKLIEGAHFQRIGARFNEEFMAAKEDPVLGPLAIEAEREEASRA